uniref:Uncharacterized protein n=1 Tax=Oryza meridionalis TaxID=40149 RepID=A0A0E0BVW0_9ORYZ
MRRNPEARRPLVRCDERRKPPYAAPTSPQRPFLPGSGAPSVRCGEVGAAYGGFLLSSQRTRGRRA